ncbi:MAG: hypothetical protein K940chlam9_01189 [Chlamydiae bacterium]|nr:hypothetical protein [Chlamydiota bacterium]
MVNPIYPNTSLIRSVAKFTLFTAIACAILTISFQSQILATTGTFSWGALTAPQLIYCSGLIVLTLGSLCIHVITDFAVRKREC